MCGIPSHVTGGSGECHEWQEFLSVTASAAIAGALPGERRLCAEASECDGGGRCKASPRDHHVGVFVDRKALAGAVSRTGTARSTICASAATTPCALIHFPICWRPIRTKLGRSCRNGVLTEAYYALTSHRAVCPYLSIPVAWRAAILSREINNTPRKPNKPCLSPGVPVVCLTGSGR